MSDTATTRRIVRNATLDTAFVGQTYTIVRNVRLASTKPKFHAWLTGARGRNGYVIIGTDGIERIVGRTTLDDAHARDAIDNYDEFLAYESEQDRLFKLELAQDRVELTVAKPESPDMTAIAERMAVLAQTTPKAQSALILPGSEPIEPRELILL